MDSVNLFAEQSVSFSRGFALLARDCAGAFRMNSSCPRDDEREPESSSMSRERHKLGEKVKRDLCRFPLIISGSFCIAQRLRGKLQGRGAGGRLHLAATAKKIL